MHSLEEYWSLFDLIWWKCGVPFFRVPGYDLGSPLNYSKFTIFHSLDTSCVFPKKSKFHFLELTGSMTSRGMPWGPPFFRAHGFNDIKGYALGPSIL